MKARLAENLWNFAFAYLLVILGLMFLNGYFHEERNTRFRRVIDLDKVIFPKLDNPKLVKAADRLAYAICIVCAILTAATGLLAYLHASIPNIGALFMFVGFIGSWVTRLIFIAFFIGKPLQQLPKIWPF